MSLLLTFLSGLFFIVGIIVYKFIKNKNRFNLISIACASVVILGLIVFDIIPEIIEIGEKWLVLFAILGFILLTLLDKLVPYHHHDHHDHDEETPDHKSHIAHVSTVTILALLLHNMVEGMALYGVAEESLKSGLLMCLGIGLHNLPFGFQIASYNKGKKHNVLILLLVISGFLGGVLMYLFNINELVQGIISSVTLGMLLHLFLFELLHEVIVNIKKKETICGIIIGVILFLIIFFI